MKFDYMEEYFKMKHEYEEKIKALEAELKELKSRKTTLQPKVMQIKSEDIIRIKSLRKQGLSYSQISEKTKWSKATVHRVINGFYDQAFKKTCNL